MATTVAAILKDELAECSIELSEVKLDKLCIDHGLDPGQVYTSDLADPITKAVIARLERILAQPDITEGGMSIKWDRAALQSHINRLREQLGLVVSSKPQIRNGSNRW